MAYFDLGKNYKYTEGVRILTAIVTDMIKWHWRPPAWKMSRTNLSKQGQVVSTKNTFTTV